MKNSMLILKISLSFLLLFALYFPIQANQIIDQDRLNECFCLYEASQENELLNKKNKKEVLEASITCFEKVKSWDDFVDAQNSLTEYFYYDEDFRSAVEIAERNYLFAKKVLPENNQHYLDASYNFGVMLEMRGCYEEASDYYFEVLRHKEAAPNKDMLTISAINNGIGTLYKTIGDYDKAIEFCQIAIQQMPDTSNISAYYFAPFYIGLAKSYNLKGLKEPAIKAYNNCRDIVLKHEDSQGEYLQQNLLYVYQDLAAIYLERNQTDSVNYYLKKSLRIQHKFPTLFEDYKSYEIYGQLYLKNGQHLKAKKYFRKAIEKLKSESGGIKKDYLTSGVLGQLAAVYLEEKKYDPALKIYQEALQSLSIHFKDEDIFCNPTNADIYNKFAAVKSLNKKAIAFYNYYKDKKDIAYLTASFKTFERAIEIIPSIRKRFADVNAKMELSNELKSVYENGIKLSIELYQLTCDKYYKEKAFYFAESNKANVLKDKIMDNIAMDRSNIPDSLLNKEQRIRLDINSYLEEIYNAQDSNDSLDINIEELKVKLNSKKITHRLLLQQLEKEYPIYATMKNAHSIKTISEIQAILEEHTAVVEYFVGEKTISIFVISQTEYSTFQIPNSLELLEAFEKVNHIVSLRPSGDLESYSSQYQSFHKNAFFLFEEMMAEPIESLKDSIVNLVIIPDAYLNHLPFEALLTTPPVGKANNYFSAQNLSYLLDDYAINYNYSATMMSMTSNKNTSSDLNPFLGIAPSFNDLKRSESLMENIQNKLGGDVLTGEEATKGEVLNQLGQYKIVHFSTHAKMNADQPHLNSIELFESNLTSNEIEQLRFMAPLVVLGACETAVGKNFKGEGLMSLARSFFIAGCSSITASLWKIDEEATSKIMDAYYDNLLNGLNKADALRKAKLGLIAKEGDRIHPYDWAGILQFGDTNPLFKETEEKKPWFFFPSFFNFFKN